MKVDLLRYPTDHDWDLAKLCAITTQGYRKVVNPPDTEWMQSILRSRESPLRSLHFLIRFDTIPSFVATHLVRHVHLQPYVQTKRDDLQDDKETDRWTPVLMVIDINAEELLTVANKRLCGRAHEETRKAVREMCRAVIDVRPEFKPFLVPFCMEYGCHERKPCGDSGRYLP